jgi:hypothetical protein
MSKVTDHSVPPNLRLAVIKSQFIDLSHQISISDRNFHVFQQCRSS